MAVTRADVARLAGVSPALVSYVINPGSRPVSADARRRIEAAIAELGYRPNAIAQALRRSSSRSIGLLMPTFTSPVVSYAAENIEELFREHGYVMLSGNTGGASERETSYLQDFISRGVDALLLISTASPEGLATAAASGVPVIALDNVPEEVGVSTIRVDAAGGAESAVKHLIEVHGHTRIACIAADWPPHSQAESRVVGWRSAMTAAGLPAGDDLLVRAETFDRAGGWNAVGHVLDATDATAAFVTSDVKAIGALNNLRSRGVRVPEDFAVVSYDGTVLAGSAWPRLTTVDQGIPELAAVVVERLLEKIKNKGSAPTHDVFPTTLVIRESCGCPPAAQQPPSPTATAVG